MVSSLPSWFNFSRDFIHLLYEKILKWIIIVHSSAVNVASNTAEFGVHHLMRLEEIDTIGGETVHPYEHIVISPFRHEWGPNECSSTPRIWNVSLLSCMTLWNIFMKRSHWSFPGKRGQFPFRRSVCERRHLSNERTGKSYGFFGFKYTCHVSPDLSPNWSPLVLEK